MTKDKLISDTQTVMKFIQLYCDKKHDATLQKDGILEIIYENESYLRSYYHLCPECEALLLYSYARLQECPHEEKPSCRKCPHPCYEKSMWKKMAKVMMYSGMQLGLTKIRKLFFK